MPTDRDREVAGTVAEVYNWVDSQIDRTASRCEACGKCCDFENYDHRLFVTSPELIFFSSKIGPDKTKPMPAALCPYNIGGECSVYPYRFGGCRIFFCKGDNEFQSRLSEQTVGKFKAICETFHIPYRYTDLAAALNGIL
ncbi:MAG: hypothetical protein ACYTFK_04515 [Planctomycetota bacterium]|jgi:hypothetical protein